MPSNGLGPRWFPAFVRRALSKAGSYFFDEASWDTHDIGYERGYPARSVCDRKFLQAMLRDASLTTTTLRVFACTAIAWFLWLMVRLFGWLTYNKTGAENDLFHDR